MAKWTKKKLWTNFLTTLQWDGIKNWNDMDDSVIELEIPKCRDWVARNIHYIQTEEAKIAFKDFFYTAKVGETSNAYYWKDRAVEALAALYAKERANGYG